ncbi:MAG: hypothetical protein MZW92_70940 [Comamonadaceae bacterium]|nr:hypothetical protein [Comamonadaceae bacterium]
MRRGRRRRLRRPTRARRRGAWRRDVREGYVTTERAREDYRVALDQTSGDVDADATAALRTPQSSAT